METAKIAVDSCYVLRQFLTPLPSIDFREIRGGLLAAKSAPGSRCLLVSNLYTKLRTLSNYVTIDFLFDLMAETFTLQFEGKACYTDQDTNAIS